MNFLKLRYLNVASGVLLQKSPSTTANPEPGSLLLLAFFYRDLRYRCIDANSKAMPMFKNVLKICLGTLTNFYLNVLNSLTTLDLLFLVTPK